MTHHQRDLEAELAHAQEETRQAFESRALIYGHLYDVLEEEFGPERAADLMKRAIYRRGLEIAAKYRAASLAGDLEEVGRLFVEESACDGTLFTPCVEERALCLRAPSPPSSRSSRAVSRILSARSRCTDW